MRTLVIAGEYPWPVNSGSRTRLLTTLGGLATRGPTELFSVIPRRRGDFGLPDPRLRLERVETVAHPDEPVTGLHRLSTLRRPLMPEGIPWRDGHAVEAALRDFARGPYDLVWIFGAKAWALSGEPRLGPTVVDLDDLEDQKILGRLRAGDRAARGWAAHLHDLAGGALSRLEVVRWRRLYRRIGGACDTVVVCSSLDAERAGAIGLSRVEVVPNTSRSDASGAGRGGTGGSSRAGLPPTVLFQGTLRYPPNADAARFLACSVGPALRRRVPDARIRMVGVVPPGLADLDDPPRVSLIGQVADMASELERADAVVVPLRYGSGTRVKVLEAFAHHVPVASTSVGAEGLAVENERHLLIGDSAEELAVACHRLLSDVELRRRLVANARLLFDEVYRPDLVETKVATVGERAATR